METESRIGGDETVIGDIQLATGNIWRICQRSGLVTQMYFWGIRIKTVFTTMRNECGPPWADWSPITT